MGREAGSSDSDGVGSARGLDRRIFSGIQPSGRLHLGHYLGALSYFSQLQDTGRCLYCVVDMHAITVWQDPETLRRGVHEVTAGFIAAGVDPERSIIFRQSGVGAHAELAWILNCVARIGWLTRMTQFKDKAGKDRENASVGLLVYPVLMAADILVYKATDVPVGEDQQQHLELTREIARKFNADFGDRIRERCGVEEYFPQVKGMVRDDVSRVMSLRDGGKKMSSSDASDQARINLLDDADTIALKLRRARTDSDPLPEGMEGLEGRPEVRNLVGVYAALRGISVSGVLGEYGGRNFSVFKEGLTDLMVDRVVPVGVEMQRLLKCPGELDTVLRKGAEQAEEIAGAVLDEVKGIVGLS